jgi:hypothetical protein
MTDNQGLRTEPQESARTAPSEGRRLPWWAGALALVLAVAVGVGIGFFTSGRDSATSTTADPQVEQFLDADAIRAISTADAVLNTRDLTATGATSLEARVEDYRADGVSFERVGAPIVSDVGDAIDVVQLFRGGTSEGNRDKYILVLRLVKDDDMLKVEWDRTYNYQTWRSLLGL